VKARTVDDRRMIQIRADQAHREKLRENDRVKVNYRVGKYTGTVGGAEISLELKSPQTRDPHSFADSLGIAFEVAS
jgi:hypothetical protein